MNTKSGFTLVEFPITLALAVILFSVIMPKIHRASPSLKSSRQRNPPKR